MNVKDISRAGTIAKSQPIENLIGKSNMALMPQTKIKTQIFGGNATERKSLPIDEFLKNNRKVQ